MTYSENETVMAALAEYEKQQARKARRERKAGEAGKAGKAQAEAGKARALLWVFAELLSIPAGEAKI